MNPHEFPRQILSLVRLPIPPLSRPPALRAGAGLQGNIRRGRNCFFLTRRLAWIGESLLDVRNCCLESLNIRQLATKDETPRRPTDSGKNHQIIHSIDFVVDPNDLNLKHDADWNYKAKLNLCFITFDRYAHTYSNSNREASYLCLGGARQSTQWSVRVGPARFGSSIRVARASHRI